MDRPDQADIDSQPAAKGWRLRGFGEASIAAFGATHEERTLETRHSGGFGGG